MGRRVLLSLALLPAYAIGIYAPAAAGAQHDVPRPVTVVRSAHATVESEHGVVRGRAARVASEVDRLFTLIGQDLGDTPPRLQIHLYASHATFALALHSQQRIYPQSSVDNTSAIVHETLLLGPLPAPYLQHNLAHVYTE
jgi:hypothetical protein